MSKRKVETIAFLDTIIEHPAFGGALDAVTRAHATSGYKAKGTIIFGDSGVGKTTLIDEYLLEWPRVEESDRTRVPVIAIETHSGQNVKAITEEILDALDFPYPARSTQRHLYKLMKQAFKELGVELVFFDEFQEVLPQKTKDSPNIMRFIKRAMNDTKVPWVLVGTDQTKKVLELSDGNQLRRRFCGAYRLRPFSIRTTSEFDDFTRYISVLQEALPFNCKLLTEENYLLRLYCSTLGIPGFIANLFEQLVELHSGDGAVTLEHLAAAHQRAFVGSGDTKAGSFLAQNPFLLPISKIKEIAGRM